MGHINVPNQMPVPKITSSYKLSVARAKMVYEYLIHHGIPGSRMSYAGYGNWQMEYPKAVYEEENAANRRVEIKILQVN